MLLLTSSVASKASCCSCSSVAKAVRITNNVTVDDDVVVAMGDIGVDDVAVGNVEVLLQLDSVAV